MSEESKKTVFRRVVVAPTEKKKYLVGNTPPYLGKPFELAKPQFTIGREEGRDLQVASDMVSRHHASILVKDNRCFIRDEESSNGTFLNGGQLTPHEEKELAHRDIMKFDAFEFIFVDTAQADLWETLKPLDRAGSKIVSLYSPKGGTGLTSTAINLAHELGRLSSKKVALIDLDLRFGDVLSFLSGKPGKSIYELSQNETEITGDTVKKFLLPGNGFNFLAAPPQSEFAELIKVDHVKKALWSLEAEHDFVIADLKHDIDDVTIQVWEMSSAIWLIAKPEFGQLVALRRVLGIMDKLKYPETKVRLLIAGVGREQTLNEEELKQMFPKRPVVTLPYSPNEAVQTSHLGKLYVVEGSSGALAQGITNLARTILGEEVEVKQASVFSKLKSLLGF